MARAKVFARVIDDFARARVSAALCPRSAASGLIAYLGRLLSGCVRVLAIARRGDFAVRHEDRTMWGLCILLRYAAAAR